ncbi:MAG: formylglycine-generating enzyme family protein [Myxococcales bacterium]|nr:formylglycine-generating enzyme family protein [Myxococcales bacterium]
MRPALSLLLVGAAGLLGCRSDSTPGETTAPRGETSAAVTASATASASAAESAACPPCDALQRCEAGKCVSACPEGEIYIPATGPAGFEMGDDGKQAKKHRVILTKPFCIDATEVTVKAYEVCVKAGKCEEPRRWGMWINYPTQQDHPVNKVHWKHAKAYCEFREQSLPSEAQWVWAARGDTDHGWAWGNEEPTCEHADFVPGELRSGSSDDGCHGGGTSPVGSHPKGDRVWPSGHIHDLSGNVWEWCLDNFLPFKGEDETDPVHLDAENNAHVVRGGGWNRSARGIRVDFRGGSPVDYQVPGLGFRCVRNPP